MEGVVDAFIMFLSLFGYSQDQETPISHECQPTTLVHPFLDQLREKTIWRYVEIDQERIGGYVADIHEDVHVEIYVQDKVGIILAKDGKAKP